MLGVSIAASMLTVPLSVLGVPTVHRVVCSMIADIACIQVYIIYLVHAYHIGSHSAGLPHSHKHNFSGSVRCVAQYPDSAHALGLLTWCIPELNHRIAGPR